MKTYVLKRLLLMIPTLFGVSLVVWVITALAPEPPIQSRMPGVESGRQAGEAGVMTRAVKAYRAQYGLDKPAILNFYYELDPDEVEATLREAGVRGSEDPEQIKRTFRAKEQLIRWGYYAVPAIVEVLSRAEGDLRDLAAAWFLNNAERVTRFDPSAELDEETAAENVLITTENRILALYAFRPGNAEEKKAAGVAAIRSWFRGARTDFAEGESLGTVRAAVEATDEARVEGLGPRAVPGLVRLVLESSDVVMVPGTPFGAPGYVRISFACSIEELEDAIGRIRKALS